MGQRSVVVTIAAVIVVLVLMSATTIALASSPPQEEAGDAGHNVTETDVVEQKDEESDDSDSSPLSILQMNSTRLFDKLYGSLPPNPLRFRHYSASGYYGATTQTIGFAVGGAKSVSSFRENIRQGFLPPAGAVTSEGLFNEYYFNSRGAADEDRTPSSSSGSIQENTKAVEETNALDSSHSEESPDECTDLFCPVYSSAVFVDDQRTEPEEELRQSVYLSVGLTSGVENYTRPDADLVLLIDRSGSMHDLIDRYAYDATKRDADSNTETPRERNIVGKQELANRGVERILASLRPTDNVAVVAFDDDAEDVIPMTTVRDLSGDLVSRKISQVTPRGGTNLEAGLQHALRVMAKTTKWPTSPPRLRRIVILTDAQLNAGSLSGDYLRRTAEESGVYITMVGIGVDFAADLARDLSQGRGANHISVRSADDFNKRVVREFDLLISPLVFDLEMSLAAPEGWVVGSVYGVPGTDTPAAAANLDGNRTVSLMSVATLFPSPATDSGAVKGGIILVHLLQSRNHTGASSAAPVIVHVNLRYTDARTGTPVSTEQPIHLRLIRSGSVPPTATRERSAQLMRGVSQTVGRFFHVESSAVRKGAVLARYFDTLRKLTASTPTTQRSTYEQTSKPLVLPETVTVAELSAMQGFLEAEAKILGDQALLQESALIATLLAAVTPAPLTP